MERKDKERVRRLQMKELCFKLSSLIPRKYFASSSKDAMTQHDNMDVAVAYILELKERIEKLRKIRDSKSTLRGVKRSSISRCNCTSSEIVVPVIEVRPEESNLEVILVTGTNDRFKLHHVIGILEEEGAEVKNANISVLGDRVIYMIHSEAVSSRIGMEASRVLERLQDLVS